MLWAIGLKRANAEPSEHAVKRLDRQARILNGPSVVNAVIEFYLAAVLAYNRAQFQLYRALGFPPAAEELDASRSRSLSEYSKPKSTSL